MAAAAKLENIHIIEHTNTITGNARIYLVLTGGSDAASLTMTVGSSALVIKAPAGETVALPEAIRLGRDIVATFTLSGTAPTAYAIECFDR